MNNVFLVRLFRVNLKNDHIFVHFACSLETVEQIVERLNDGKMVLGTRMWVKRGEDEQGNFNIITNTRDIAIGPIGIMSIENAVERYIMQEDAPCVAENA